MNYQEFMDEIKKGMKERYPDSKVEIRKVTKVNNIVMHGLTILPKGMNITPTIYLEALYERYQNGMDFEKILSILQDAYEKEIPKNMIDMNFFKEFDKVKDRIIYRLLNAEQNEGLLQNIPHIRFLDLAICFMYDYRSEELGRGTILIHNSHMDCWGTDTKKLMELAEVNTPKLLPIVFQSVSDMVTQMVNNNEVDTEFDEEDLGVVLERMRKCMYVLTNEEKSYGAAAILYPRALEYVASVLKSDFFVIPSSAHEVLIVPITTDETIDVQRDTLHSMISEINEQQLPKEEILSDYPYLYKCKEGKLIQV